MFQPFADRLAARHARMLANLKADAVGFDPQAGTRQDVRHAAGQAVGDSYGAAEDLRAPLRVRRQQTERGDSQGASGRPM